MSEEPCQTCQGRVWSVRHGKWVARRETVGMVCQTCGTDYAPTEATEGQRQAAEEPPWGDDVAFGETCRRDAKLRDQIAEVIADWMAQPHKPEDWQRNNADDLTADLLPYVHAYEAKTEARGRAQGRAEVAARVEGLIAERAVVAFQSGQLYVRVNHLRAVLADTEGA